MQDAILHLSVGMFGIRSFGQRNRTIELPVLPFCEVSSAFRLVLFDLAFSLNDQHVIVDLNLHVVFRKARQLGIHDQVAILVADSNGGIQAATLELFTRAAAWLRPAGENT